MIGYVGNQLYEMLLSSESVPSFEIPDIFILILYAFWIEFHQNLHVMFLCGSVLIGINKTSILKLESELNICRLLFKVTKFRCQHRFCDL